MYGLASTPSTSSVAASQASFTCNKPSTLLGSALLATHNVSRQRVSIAFRFKKFSSTLSGQASSISIACKYEIPDKKTFSRLHGFPRKDVFSFSAASKSFFAARDEAVRGVTFLPERRKSSKPPAAYNEFYKFKYPVLKVKPEWWWRTLACVPYLIGLQISYTGYLFQPFVQRYDYFADIIFFVPGAITRLPIWFVMVYSYCVYIGIVKNKDWPHYFRFHVVMGMLLELLLQIIWTASNFFPLIHYDGMLGPYYWAIVGVAHIVLTLMCVVSALTGGYCNIPIISDAAYIHTLFHIGGFQRPF